MASPLRTAGTAAEQKRAARRQKQYGFVEVALSHWSTSGLDRGVPQDTQQDSAPASRPALPRPPQVTLRRGRIALGTPCTTAARASAYSLSDEASRNEQKLLAQGPAGVLASPGRRAQWASTRWTPSR
eukprot:6016200-Prymnesium_polylepis.2